MMKSSLFGFRLSIVQLNDRKNALNIDHIIQTMLSTTHNISPVGILFNYDCPHSKSFISAVSENKKKQFVQFRISDKLFRFQCSTAKCFAEHFKWLIFEENIDSMAIQQFQVISLFIDAEIAYINFAVAIESANKRCFTRELIIIASYIINVFFASF